jgi:hypothetical protein
VPKAAVHGRAEAARFSKLSRSYDVGETHDFEIRGRRDIVLQRNRLDERRIVVLDIPDTHALTGQQLS